MLLRSAVALLPAATLVLGNAVPINAPGHTLSLTRETEPLPVGGASISGRTGSALSPSSDESKDKRHVVIPPSHTRVKRKSGHHNNGGDGSDSGSDSGSSTGSSSGSNSGSDDGADADSDPTTDTSSSPGSTSSSGSSSSSGTHSNPKSKPHRNKDNTTTTEDDDDDDDDDESGGGRAITLSISFTAGLILLATALQL